MPLGVGKQEGKRLQPCYNRCGQRWHGASCVHSMPPMRNDRS